MNEQKREQKRTWTAEHLSPGDMWADKNGVYVVCSVESAKWRGDDRDVYAHISYWYTVRPADENEREIWGHYVELAREERAMRQRIGATRYEFDGENRQMKPTSAMTRKLDSYDDRWEPPKAAVLNDEDFDLEQRFLAAQAATRGRNG